MKLRIKYLVDFYFRYSINGHFKNCAQNLLPNMDGKQSKSDKKRRSKLQLELKRVEQDLQERDSESSNELVVAEDEK